MAESERGSSSTGVVAIFAIVMMVVIAGFIAWRAGVFGGGDGGKKSLDINVNTPSSSN
jgi:hypothetical protein